MMNEIFYYLKLKNLSKNWENMLFIKELGKYAFHWEKWNFTPIGNSAHAE